MLPAGQRVEYKYVILEEQVRFWACLEQVGNSCVAGLDRVTPVVEALPGL